MKPYSPISAAISTWFYTVLAGSAGLILFLGQELLGRSLESILWSSGTVLLLSGIFTLPAIPMLIGANNILFRVRSGAAKWFAFIISILILNIIIILLSALIFGLKPNEILEFSPFTLPYVFSSFFVAGYFNGGPLFYPHQELKQDAKPDAE